ncbi:hypothetical protein BMB171_C0044 [Bacillus thuringiensis BMB171]|nr:hypothetical protein BMB171_C0044 [Bacillus thuringiensis BMB171]
MFVYWEACRLNNEYIATTDTFFNVNLNFSITKTINRTFS